MLTHALYTLRSANEALPLVRSISASIVTDFKRLRMFGRRRRALICEWGDEDKMTAGVRRACESLAVEINKSSSLVESYLREIAQLGLEARDLEFGDIEFPALHRGAPAFLCWRYGEASVCHWRPADSMSSADRIRIVDKSEWPAGGWRK